MGGGFQAAPGEFWVVKPEHADGVKPTDNEKLFLTSTFNDLQSRLQMQISTGGATRTRWVAQKYIKNPMLHKGLKFDIRLHVVRANPPKHPLPPSSFLFPRSPRSFLSLLLLLSYPPTCCRAPLYSCVVEVG